MDTYSPPPGNNSRLLPLKATQTELRLCVGVGFSIHWLCFAALWPATKRDDYKRRGSTILHVRCTALCNINCMLEVHSAGPGGAIIHIYTSACSAISYFYTVGACKLSFRADYHCLWSIHAGVAVLCPIPLYPPVREVMMLFLFCTIVSRMNDRPSAILVVLWMMMATCCAFHVPWPYSSATGPIIGQIVWTYTFIVICRQCVLWAPICGFEQYSK